MHKQCATGLSLGVGRGGGGGLGMRVQYMYRQQSEGSLCWASTFILKSDIRTFRVAV